MSKKIYSFLLGGAVALAAFAATEFVGNGNVGKNQLIQDAKPIFVATPTADVDGTAITVNYAFTENALVKVQNVWEDEPVLASSFDMTKGDIAVSLALVNEDNETVATETATATAGNETAPVVFSDVTPGTYSITVSAKFNAATSSIEETITNVVVNKPVEAEPYEISLLSFGWPFVTLQKDDEYYVGTIELSTGNVAFNLGVKMNESDVTYTVYGPTAAYTLDDADYVGNIEANENTWLIVQKNNYDVKLNWADKSIEITKAAAPTPTFPDQLYISWANYKDGDSLATPLTQDENEPGVYEGIINPSDFGQMQWMCLTTVSKDWTVVYTAPTEYNNIAVGSTYQIAETTSTGLPWYYGWNIEALKSLTYQLVFNVNLNTHQLKVTKYEAPLKDNVIYLASGPNGTVYGELEETAEGSGIYTSDNVTLANNIQFYLTKNYKEGYDNTAAAWCGLHYMYNKVTDAKLADNATFEGNLLPITNGDVDKIQMTSFTPGRLEITVNLNNSKIEIKRYVEPQAVTYPEKLYFVNYSTSAETEMTNEGDGVYTLSKFAIAGNTFSPNTAVFYFKASDTEKYGAADNANITHEGLVDGGITAYNDNEWTIVKGKYDITVDLKDPANINVTYVGGPDTVDFVINETTTPINNDGNDVYTTTYQQLTNKEVDFTIGGKAGKVAGEYGLYTISYTYGADAPTVTKTKAYTVKPESYEAPTFFSDNNKIKISFTAPGNGYLYDGAAKIEPAVEAPLAASTTLYITEATLGNVVYEMVAPGALYEETINADYGQTYVFETSCSAMEVPGNFENTVVMPAAALEIEAELSGDKTVVNVTWGPSISGATYTVTVTEKDDNSKAAPYTDTVSTTNCAIPVSVFAKEDAVYVIEVVANWEGGRADANKEFDGLTGIEGIVVDGDAVYFDLNGRQVVNPENGLYIRVANGKAQKMIIRK